MLNLLVLLALIAAAFPFTKGRATQVLVYLTSLVLGYFTLQFASHLVLTPDQEWTESYTWSTALGFHFDFVLDAAGACLAILITGIGAGVFLYAYEYMRGKPNLNFFFSTLTVFTMAMSGLVMADNFLLFFVFWELTSLCSFHLVGFKNTDASTRLAARKALLITVFGGLFLLVGFLLLSLNLQAIGYSFADSLQFSKLGTNLSGLSQYAGILTCFAIAIASKSALFPFHIWLPGAMAGPTPVSSYLHSATMVKAGIFLICRLHPSLGGTELWFYLFTTLGSLTMLTGAYLAASHRDIKKILAYSTISVLGILTMLLGISTEYSVKAAVVFLVSHAFYKAALFQIIGNIDYASGNRNIKTLGGLAKVLPFTALAAALATFSMAGSPPFFGFFGKELAYMAKVQLGGSGIMLIVLAVITNILLVGLALSVCFFPFWRKLPQSPHLTKKPSRLMQGVPLVFAILGLVVGLLPGLFDEYFGTAMATAVYGTPLVMKLKYWHGLNPEAIGVLLLSVFTLGAGVIVAIRLKSVIILFDRFKTKAQFLGPKNGFERLMDALPAFGGWITSKIQTGNLRIYLHVYLYAMILLLIPVLLQLPAADVLGNGFDGVGFALVSVAILPLFLLTRSLNFFKKLIYLGFSGLMIVLLFALFGAYDLALTLLMVETLSIFFLLKLKENNSTLTSTSRWYSMIPVFAVGSILTALLMFETSEVARSVTQYYLQNSLTLAFGKNVVNVILVDFRAMDTFGEVLVIAIAALGIIHSLGTKNHEL